MIRELFSIILRFALDGFSKSSQSDSVKTEIRQGWNGTNVAIGQACKTHQMGMRGCTVRIDALDAMHANVTILRGNRTWKTGDCTKLGIWWLEGGAL